MEDIKKTKKQTDKKGSGTEPIIATKAKIAKIKKVKTKADKVEIIKTGQADGSANWPTGEIITDLGAESSAGPLKATKVKKIKTKITKKSKNEEKSVSKTSAAIVKRAPKEKKLAFKDSSEAAKFAAKIADERKADYIKILNVGPRLAITDYFVIIGASNTRLTRHIAEEIQENLKKYNIYAMHIEGAAEGNWILIDFDDFVVHIFTDEYRQYYDIERLWRDSKVIRLKGSDTDIDEASGDNLKPGTDEYPDEQSLFSDEGIILEVKDI